MGEAHDRLARLAQRIRDRLRARQSAPSAADDALEGEVAEGIEDLETMLGAVELAEWLARRRVLQAQEWGVELSHDEALREVANVFRRRAHEREQP